MPYLTAPESTKTDRTYRYFVELALDKLDHEGVPERFQIIDVVVLEPTEEAIKILIAAAGWLDGWSMVSCWVPEADDCDCF
jgi:hypothetical protein